MRKILLALGLVLILSSCSKDEYKSVRHPEGEESIETVEKTEPEDQTENQEATSDDTKEDAPSDDISAGVEVRVSDTVNMRLAPSENSGVVGQVGPDDEILNLGETEGWTRVTSNGKTGYIRSDLLVGN